MGTVRDTYATPPEFFNLIQNFYNIKFDIDVCASPENTKCDIYITERMNAFTMMWNPLKETASTMSEYIDINKCYAWCNPPYSNAKPWFLKAVEETENNVHTYILTHSCFDTGWYQSFLHNFEQYISKIIMITPRIEFIPPESITNDNKTCGNMRGSMITVIERYKSYKYKNIIEVSIFDWKNEIEYHSNLGIY